MHSYERGLEQVRVWSPLAQKSKAEEIDYQEVARGVGADGELAYNMVYEVMGGLSRKVSSPKGEDGGFKLNAPQKMLEGILRRKAGRGDNLFSPMRERRCDTCLGKGYQ